ncbi:MAG: haloacid dehalogenase type II [Gammaproteobacteria bacterium]|nr:MAG: haloacid dehalogenase type II [Gammaproteobacteria bacterium]
MITLAFDVYGTLIDTQGVVEALREVVGEQADELARAWREKQLEYSFRRGLMQYYVDFATCTAQALDYCCQARGISLSSADRQALLDGYGTLPAFEDVPEALCSLETAGVRLFAFSNGTREAVEGLLGHAGIRQHFLDVVSVDELRSFKPNPAVYCHFLRRAGATGEASWLISGNPFDVIGARAAGMHAAWVRRGAAVFDPWGIEPDLTVGDLGELADYLSGIDHSRQPPSKGK